MSKITLKKFLEEAEEAANPGISTFTQFISALFGARDRAHEIHLATESYAQHAALNELYELLLDFADELAEMYQGKFGKLPLKTIADAVPGDDAKSFLSSLVEWLEGPGKGLVGDNAAIINKYEELVGDVYRVKYKIDNLA